MRHVDCVILCKHLFIFFIFFIMLNNFKRVLITLCEAMLFLVLLRKGGSHVNDILCLNGSLLDLSLTFLFIFVLFQFDKFITCII